MQVTTKGRGDKIECLSKYLNSVKSMNQRTAIEYEYRLRKFDRYLSNVHSLSIDDTIDKLLKRKIDVYDLLAGFISYLKENEHIENPNTIRAWLIMARTFLEYHDVEISPRKFKFKVRLPKAIVRQNPDLKLKTYVMLLATTGMRATEALMLRQKEPIRY